MFRHGSIDVHVPRSPQSSRSAHDSMLLSEEMCTGSGLAARGPAVAAKTYCPIDTLIEQLFWGSEATQVADRCFLRRTAPRE